MRASRTGISSGILVFVSVVVVVVAGGAYLSLAQSNPPATTGTSSTTGTSALQGVVTGYVTVGPAQPVCQANQSCDVNLTGYSLDFAPACLGPEATCPSRTAQISPSGHYSILLPAGNYTVTGLSPSCPWMGCASAFPKTITVAGGMQLVFNVDIDTGIR